MNIGVQVSTHSSSFDGAGRSKWSKQWIREKGRVEVFGIIVSPGPSFGDEPGWIVKWEDDTVSGLPESSLSVSVSDASMTAKPSLTISIILCRWFQVRPRASDFVPFVRTKRPR